MDRELRWTAGPSRSPSADEPCRATVGTFWSIAPMCRSRTATCWQSPSGNVGVRDLESRTPGSAVERSEGGQREHEAPRPCMGGVLRASHRVRSLGSRHGGVSMIDWTHEAIERWSARYSVQRAGAAGLWTDIDQLALQFGYSALRGGPEMAEAWHHLLLSVGNFKRQSPIFPANLTKTTQQRDESIVPDAIFIPELGGTQLERDLPSSWCQLTSVDGIGTATATTVLAALWPHHHFILDKLVLHIAGALRAEEDDTYLDSLIAPYKEASMEIYIEIRQRFLAIAKEHRVPLQHLERASFILSDGLGTDPSRTWRQYIEALNDKLVGR